MAEETKQAASAFWDALSPRERLSPSAWAERHRMLGREETSEPGPYKFDRTPYWREIADAVARVDVEELVILKGAQVGWSELCRNVLGYWIDQDPDPTLVLMPDENSAQSWRDERLEPLLRNTDAVARHLSVRAWDTTRYRVRFDTCSVFIAWAGSKTGTKSRPVRRLICEEPDEYPKFSSSGGDPLSKAEKRLTTYRDKGMSCMLLGGTPTSRNGNVWKRWEMCGVRYFQWLPCPHCGQYQQLRWAQVKWPEIPNTDRRRRAQQIKSQNLAWYECEHCHKAIRDHHKPTMLRSKVWASEDQVVTPDGRCVGQEPIAARRIGFRVSGLESPWIGFSQLACEWLESQGDSEALADFVNQRLAEPFEQQIVTPKLDEIAAKAEAARKAGIQPDVVPAWASLLLLTVDTQKAGFWYVVRAWGHAWRSRLIRYGYCHSFDEIYALAGQQWPVESGGQMGISRVLVDVGGGTQSAAGERREDEVYRFAERAPGFIYPLRGSSQKQYKNVVAKQLSTRRYENGEPIWLLWLATDRLKDSLMQHIRTPETAERNAWELNAGVGDDYLAQMTSERKIVSDVRTGEETWKANGENHLWDTEVYSLAAAELCDVALLPSPVQLAQQRETVKQMQEQRQRIAGQRPDWMPERPTSWGM